MFSLYVPAGFAATELIVSVEKLEDRTASFTFEDVINMPFQPARQVLAEGYRSPVYWLRVKVAPSPDGTDGVMLVRPTILDKVTLFQPAEAEAGAWAVHPASGAYIPEAQVWPSTHRTFRLPASPSEVEYYLRVESVGAIAAHISVLPLVDARLLSTQINITQLIYLAFMLFVMLWAVRMAFVTQEGLYWLFAITLVVFIIHNIQFFGYLAIIIPPDFREIFASLFRTNVFLASIVSVIFHKAVLMRYRPAWFALRLFDVMMIGMIVSMLLFWAGFGSFALQLNAIFVAIAPFVFLLNAFTARREASPGLVTMRVIYALLSGAVLLWVTALLGLSNVGGTALYGAMFHGLVTALLMFVILHLHGRNLINNALTARIAMAEMEQRRDTEREQALILEQFINMLTHETRNAMAVVNMSVSAPSFGERQRQRVSDAIAALDGIVERCSEAIRLDRKTHSIKSEVCNVGMLLQTLCDTNPQSARLVMTGEGACIVKSDPLLLEVVFHNLIDNALKYAKDDTPINIRYGSDQNACMIYFENAVGAASMPDPARVFEKYYRHPKAKNQIGSGLGLYIVDGLLRLLGGEVFYRSSAETVEFRVSLPC
ncbi:sensor histidine kinase [Roseinatronobacter thiooxidans]|uniref:sensor histidine kinase n=1 Tax=Roseinatronobacter thiooxidans TaxID=121821 RepID=UPI0020110659|nr:7TM-DISM domain-containing protein [Roseinatronobacter thiooxidans]